ncbi:N-acyl homoserine lactonase family protein [Roseomonas sp. 18066]|uniref:N-acyl homoserine lactonase family protein n=1 Tax=Roseomonas sp. 18066 TaxID=2681412 RepID=UPI00135A3354|nr:N-acyl homoserine lactonase family protein [Roseomonas sp. 18066]
MSELWEAYALRFALDPDRLAARSFLGGAGGDEKSPFAYHAFLLRGPLGWVAVDTAATAAACAHYAKPVEGTLPEAFAALGIDPDDVKHVVQTHLHWDHAGQPGLFPNATFHMQAREMAYVTGPAMRHAALRSGYLADDIAAHVALLHQGRMVLHDGTVALAPGLTLHHAGGHTDGLQFLRIRTRRGWMVLAGDTVPLRDHLARRLPFPTLYHVGDALAGFDKVEALADSPALVIPAHDPWVLEAHPRLTPHLARLD